MTIQNISGAGLGNSMPSEAISSQATRQHMPVGEAAKPSAPLESPVTAVEPAAAPPNLDTVKQATEMINKAVQSLSRNLKFTVDEETKETVVKVVDTDTGDVIRQIPSEEALAIAKALNKLQGLIIRQKA